MTSNDPLLASSAASSVGAPQTVGAAFAPACADSDVARPAPPTGIFGTTPALYTSGPFYTHLEGRFRPAQRGEEDVR